MIALVVLVLCDAIWFNLVAGKLYKSELGGILRMEGGSVKPNWYAATLVYLLLALGVALLVVPLAGGFSTAAGYGAIFGLVVYGVYDMTNLALLAQWTVKASIIDVAWGTFVGGFASLITYHLVNIWK